MRNKIAEVKQHISENKRVYIAAASGVVVGGVAVLTCGPSTIQIVDSWNLKFWSPTTSNVTQTVVMRPAGHRGNIVIDVLTGTPYPSQNEAARTFGINAGEMSKHIRGMQDTAGGRVFTSLGENLGEAVKIST